VLFFHFCNERSTDEPTRQSSPTTELADDGDERRRGRVTTRTMARGATTDAPTTRGNEDENDEETELVVLDFDLTVLSIHSFATRVRAEDVRDGTRDWKKDFVDLNHLKRFYGACVVTRWMNE